MACTITLSGIPYDCDVNLSGVKMIYLADYASITSVAVDASGNATITASDTPFYAYTPAKNTASLTKTMTKSEETGVLYFTNELVGNFNKMDLTKRKEMNEIARGQMLAVVLDNNGIYWVLGADNYVTATVLTGQTGAGPDDGNFYSVTITDVSGALPPVVDKEDFTALIHA